MIGAGPAGLACAYHLRRLGHEVEIRDAMPKPGGMMHYGIPAYRLPRDEGDIAVLFRDHFLSDLIGFVYGRMEPEAAAEDLYRRLRAIGETVSSSRALTVPVILDGENAWEYYPENGYYFLTALYRRLAQHPAIELTTFSDCVDAGLKPAPLKELVAGSWVYGTFSTWIGDEDKNRAWDMLGDAKHAFDAAVAAGRLSGAQLHDAQRQLGVCEGSDWFWWFGDYNPSDSVRDFDRLYRLQLARLYQMIGAEPPELLTHVIFHGGGAPQVGGVMRRGKEAH